MDGVDHRAADELGADDIAWPLERGSTGLFVAAKLTAADEARMLPSDELRAIALRLMRCGPPVGWLGAMLLMGRPRAGSR